MSDSGQFRDEHERQLDAMIARYYRAVEEGLPPDRDLFVSQHPEFERDLREFFTNLGLLDGAVPQTEDDPALANTRTMSASQRNKLTDGSVVRYFGEYEILGELGVGGMGVVYKARQTRLGRIVALKMIRAGELANPQDVKRFQAETRAAARLTHAGIVAVHEVGIHNGQHFYTMDYVEGGSLSRLHRDEPVPARHAAEIIKQLAEAIHYSHGLGIVHRDLKPANILLAKDGSPKITDFGLAKRMWADVDSVEASMTETGQILGTAGYMSPEQAAGKTRLVGPPADIYALGAVLYALLTSRAPFVGESQADTILQVIHKEPVSPRALNPSIARDLETICLRCLEKEPHKRYGTAQLLADDVGRFVEGRPVLARPISRPARAWRWCRRNPWVATAVALLMILAFGSPPVAYRQYRLTITTITQKEDIEKKAEQIEADAEKLSEYAEKLTEQNTQIKGLLDDVTKELSEKNAALAKVTSAEAKEREARGIAETETASKSLTLYVSDMNRMQTLWQEASLRTMRSLLARHVPTPDKTDLRDFEWYYWQRKCHQERRQFVHGRESDLLALSPDGKWLATAGPLDEQTHAIKVWNLVTGHVEKPIPVAQAEIVAMEFTADGSQLVTVRQGKAVAASALNWRTGELGLPRPLQQGETIPGTPVGRYAVSPSGKLVARSLMGRVSCLRLDNGEWFQIKLTDDAEIQRVRAKSDRVIYSTPEGKYVYFQGDVPGTTRIRQGGLITETSLDISRFRPRSWQISDELAPPREEDGGPVFALQFSPAEDRLAAGSRHGELIVWELSSGKELIRVDAHADLVWDVAFSADGQRLATASKDGRIKLWDVPSGQLQATIEAHADGVRTVAFTKRGMLVSGGNDQCVKVWSEVTGNAVATFRGHEQAINDVAICSDGETIFSTSRDGKVNEWSLRELEPPVVVADATPLTCVDASSGGDLLAASGLQSNEVTVWEAGTGQIKATLRGQRGPAFHVRVAPDGNSVVAGTWDGTFTTWDLASEKIIAQRMFPLRPNLFGMFSAAISPNARRLAGVCKDGKAHIFDLSSGQEIVTLAGDVILARMRFSPDGSELLTFVKRDNSFDIRLWNTETGTAPEDIVAGASIALAAFSNNGKLLAWCERLGTPDSTSLAVKVLDRSTKEVKPRMALPVEMTTVQAVAFSPDHSLVAAIASEKKLSKNTEPVVSALLVWDVITGRKLHHFEESGAALCFLPDGNTIAVAGNSGRVNVWGLVEGRKLKTLARPFGPAMSVAYVTNGTALKEPKLLVASQAPPREGMVAPKTIARTSLALSDPNRQEQAISPVHIPMPKTVFQPLSDGTLSERGWLVRLLKLDANATKQFGFVNSVTPSLDAYAPTANCVFVLCPNGTLLKGPADKQGAVMAVAGAVVKVEDAKAMAATPDGRWVALAVGATIQLWDGDQLVLRHTLEGHEDIVRSLAFSRDGELLGTGGLDRCVRLWNTSDGSLRAVLLGHLKPITCLAFSERGGTAFSASYDGTIRLWDTATGEAKSTFTGHVGPVHWIELSPEDDELASAGEDGTVRLWRGPSTAPK